MSSYRDLIPDDATIVEETRWNVFFTQSGESIMCIVSKLGSGAKVSYFDLVAEWETWTLREKRDFVTAMLFANINPDHIKIINFFVETFPMSYQSTIGLNLVRSGLRT